MNAEGNKPVDVVIMHTEKTTAASVMTKDDGAKVNMDDEKTAGVSFKCEENPTAVSFSTGEENTDVESFDYLRANLNRPFTSALIRVSAHHVQSDRCSPPPPSSSPQWSGCPSQWVVEKQWSCKVREICQKWDSVLRRVFGWCHGFLTDPIKSIDRSCLLHAVKEELHQSTAVLLQAELLRYAHGISEARKRNLVHSSFFHLVHEFQQYRRSRYHFLNDTCGLSTAPAGIR